MEGHCRFFFQVKPLQCSSSGRANFLFLFLFLQDGGRSTFFSRRKQNNCWLDSKQFSAASLNLHYRNVSFSISPRLGGVVKSFNILIFAKMLPLSYTSRISQDNRISYDCRIFPGLPVLLAQLLKGCKLFCVSRCYFCQSLASFHRLSFSRHLFHFTADFATLLYTKLTIYPTL